MVGWGRLDFVLSAEDTVENLVSRRPIFLSDGRIQAYELAFHDGLEKYLVSEETHKKLPSEVLYYMFGLMGNEELRKRPTFVQIGPDMVLDAPVKTLSRQQVTLFIPQPFDVTEMHANALGDLKHTGFKLAFGDYAVDDEYAILLDFAHFIVVNYTERDEQRRRITPKFCHSKRIQVMAYNLQSREDYEAARKQDYDEFHGPFFYDPVLIEKDQLAPAQVNLLSLLEEINRMEVKKDKVEEIIKNVRRMAGKLLEHINSPQFRLEQKVNALDQAINLMGVMNLRRWATMSAVTILGERDMPEQLQHCIARGRFMFQIGEKLGDVDQADNLFFAGLYSSIACFFHRPLTELLGSIALDRSVRNALHGDEGKVKTALDLAVAVEGGDWAAIEKHSATLNLQDFPISAVYFEALQWARAIISDYKTD